MTGLVLKLAPNERVLINGAVIENGDRRARISVMTPQANILRLRDAIHPDEASTPVRRACYDAQLILSGDVAHDIGTAKLIRAIEQLSQVFTDPDSRHLLGSASEAALEGNIYRALRRLRDLLPREERLFAVARQ